MTDQELNQTILIPPIKEKSPEIKPTDQDKHEIASTNITGAGEKGKEFVVYTQKRLSTTKKSLEVVEMAKGELSELYFSSEEIAKGKSFKVGKASIHLFKANSEPITQTEWIKNINPGLIDAVGNYCKAQKEEYKKNNGYFLIDSDVLWTKFLKNKAKPIPAQREKLLQSILWHGSIIVKNEQGLADAFDDVALLDIKEIVSNKTGLNHLEQGFIKGEKFTVCLESIPVVFKDSFLNESGKGKTKPLILRATENVFKAIQKGNSMHQLAKRYCFDYLNGCQYRRAAVSSMLDSRRKKLNNAIKQNKVLSLEELKKLKRKPIIQRQIFESTLLEKCGFQSKEEQGKPKSAAKRVKLQRLREELNAFNDFLVKEKLIESWQFNQKGFNSTTKKFEPCYEFVFSEDSLLEKEYQDLLELIEQYKQSRTV